MVLHPHYVCCVLGIIEKIRQLPCNIRHCCFKERYLCSPVNHFTSQNNNCGYRNLQMLLSCLIEDATYLRHVFNGKYGFLPFPVFYLI